MVIGENCYSYICQEYCCRQKNSHSIYACLLLWFNDIPFKNRDINVIFYDIRYEKGNIKCDIDTTLEIDILYICNYFGFSTGVDFEVVVNMRRKGVIILYDKTHDFFNNGEPFVLISDYCFCSLRKWMGIPTGAIVSKKWMDISLNHCWKSVISWKINVREWERNIFIIHGNTAIVKEDFLRLFASFNKNLSRDYQDYLIDKTSLQLLNRQDLEQIKICRQRNAVLLYESYLD